SGVLFIILSATGVLEAIVNAISATIKNAITPGIGLFLTLIGLKNASLVIQNQATFVGLIDFPAGEKPLTRKPSALVGQSI
ncbi:MAG: hypothetical protein ACRC2P_14730, partial [Eubacterium aggregans]